MRLKDLKYSCAVLLLGASVSWGADYVYTPHQAAGATDDGILVREVKVKKGNTLSGLSKQYSGRGYYYPQILLFNQIKNPHLIYPGQVLRVPLGKGTVARKQPEGANQAAVPAGHSPVAAAAAVAEHQKPVAHHAADVTTSHAEKNAYSTAVAAFKKGEYDSAIKLFDEFINRYPTSALLPEATLNRAECYLKLSAK